MHFEPLGLEEALQHQMVHRVVVHAENQGPAGGILVEGAPLLPTGVRDDGVHRVVKVVIAEVSENGVVVPPVSA